MNIRWPQNGRSRGTKSSNLSGEEVFLPTEQAEQAEQNHKGESVQQWHYCECP